MEQITLMFVLLALWTSLVTACIGVAVMFRLDTIERKLNGDG